MQAAWRRFFCAEGRAVVDREAFFEELYLSTKEALFRYLCNLNGMDGWVEDILQDTYFEAYKKCEMLLIHPNPAGWLYKTAHNLYRNARRRRENCNLSLDTVEENIAAAEGYYDFTEWRMTIQGLLQEKDSQLLHKYYLEGYSVKEMAKEFNLSEENIRAKLTRIRKRIKGLCNR